MKYRPEIDGLRTVAVLPVVLFHADIAPFHGGFAGVDIFFVISGYLITSLIIEDLEAGRFSILNFYERRARRILPALFLVIAASGLAAYRFLYPLELNEFAQSVVATVFFSSNIFFWLKSDYFSTAAELKPLLHTWSLAVEEQYYLFFPPLMLLLWKGARRHVRTIGTLSLIAGASFLICVPFAGAWAGASFYLLPFRAWELAIGAICAVLLTRTALPASPLLTALGLGLIAVSLVTASDARWPSWQTLLPVLGSALTILFASADRGAGRLLATAPMVWIGLLSYSLYLWHQPLFAFARVRSVEDLSLWTKAGLIGLAILLAWLTWKLVEQPFRARRNGAYVIGPKPLAATMGMVAAAFLAFGLLGDRSDGWPERRTPSGLTFATIEQKLVGGRIDTSPCDVDLAFRAVPSQPLPDCVFAAGTPDTYGRAILLGDSHATILTPALTERLTSAGFETSVATFGGCIPFPGFRTTQRDCHSANMAMYRHVGETPYDLIVLAFRPQWMLFENDDLTSVDATGAASGGKVDVHALIRSGMDRLLATGADVVAFEPVPEMPVDIGQFARNRFALETRDDALDYAIPFGTYLGRAGSFLDVLDGIEAPGFSVIPTAASLCDGAERSCPAIENGVVLYVDDNHLSRFGVDKLMKSAESALSAIRDGRE